MHVKMDVSFRIRDQSFQQYKQMLLAEKLTFTNQKKKKNFGRKSVTRAKNQLRETGLNFSRSNELSICLAKNKIRTQKCYSRQK